MPISKASSSPRSAEVELSVSLFVPAHNPATRLIQQAAEALRERSHGQLTLRLYPNEQLGSTASQYELARTGKADIAYMMHGATPGAFPLAEIATLPFVVNDPVSGTAALLDVKSPYLEREHGGVKLLFVAANAPMAIHSTTPITSLGDFKGKRIRHAGRAVAATLAALGSVPVDIMPLRVKDALICGEIDAAAMTYEGALVNRLADATPHVFDLNANTVTFALVMNSTRYEGLDLSLRLMIEDVLGVSAGHRLAQRLAEAVAEGKRYFREAGATIIEPSRADRETLGLLVGSVIETMLTDLSRKGLPAREVYDLLTGKGTKMRD